METGQPPDAHEQLCSKLVACIRKGELKGVEKICKGLARDAEGRARLADLLSR